MAQSSIQDHVSFLAHGFRALGHDTEVNNKKLLKDHLNVMWEFFIPGYPELLASYGQKYFGKDVEYAIICTEHYSGDSFNNHKNPGWGMRYNCFAQAAQKAKFLWTMYPEDVELLKAKFGKPVALLELGYTPQMEMRDFPPAFDFSFFGTQTPHRLSVLEQLFERGFKCYIPDGIVQQEAIAGMVAQTKINLDIHGPNKIPIPSVARVARVLHSRKGMAIEYTPKDARPAHYFEKQKENEDLIEFCVRKIEGPWKEEAVAAYEKYKAEMPMKLCLQRALDEVNYGGGRLQAA